MWTNTAYQQVKLVDAEVYDDLASVPLMINFENDAGRGQVIWHLEDAELGRALVAAINGVLKAHATRPQESSNAQ